MFTFELEKYAGKSDCFSEIATRDKFSRGFEFISEPEQVLVGISAPALGIDPRYDDMERKITHWDGIRSANSLGLRAVVVMRDGQYTGERGLSQCLL